MCYIYVPTTTHHKTWEELNQGKERLYPIFAGKRYRIIVPIGIRPPFVVRFYYSGAFARIAKYPMDDCDITFISHPTEGESVYEICETDD